MWNVGKFGDLRPYAVLEPVTVGGVTIKLATLHNEEDLVRKDIRAGRGGDRGARRGRDPAGRLAGPPRRRARQAAARVRGPPPRCPVLQHPDGQAARGGLHLLPQPRLSRARLAAAQALRLARGDGHRRPRREAGGAAAGARAAAHGGRLLPAHRGAAAGARGLRRDVRAQAAGGDRGLQAAPLRAGAVRARDRGGGRGHRPQPRPAPARHRRADRRHARSRSPRPRGWGRRWRSSITPSCTTSACAG